MNALHKCSAPTIKPKAGGLSTIGPCNKLATTKSGKKYLCAEHALAEQPEKGGRNAFRAH